MLNTLKRNSFFVNYSFRLCVGFPQTSDMQWTYDIIGTTADYNPPNARAKTLSMSANSSRRTVKQKKNYVLENLKLQSTAVSSPYKGVRLTSRSARWKHTNGQLVTQLNCNIIVNYLKHSEMKKSVVILYNMYIMVSKSGILFLYVWNFHCRFLFVF